MTNALTTFLELTNETLTIAIAITAASMLLYNLVRNMQHRVTRASSILLGCVTIAYVSDSLASLDSDGSLTDIWLRMQWVGIAFMPAAMFHLADALLATTGLVSKGRRRRVVRILYTLSTVMTVMAALTDLLVRGLETEPDAHLLPGPVFAVYGAYFILACYVSMQVVWRARQRCLTTTTHRRMTYLLLVFLSPGLGIFPYSLLFESIGNGSRLPLLPLLILFNIANFSVVMMLLFMSYPLSFFGSNQPDRVVKAELLHFLLRGPLTASVLIAVMLSMPSISESMGIEDNSLLVAAVIAALLGMQWLLTETLPTLENLLIYTQDQKEAIELRKFSRRLLTSADVHQMEEAILAAICDQLRAPSAFVTVYQEDGAALEQVIGTVPEQDEVFRTITDEILPIAQTNGKSYSGDLQSLDDMFIWRSFWLFPLRHGESDELLGILGVWARRNPSSLTAEQQEILKLLLKRAARILMNQRLQSQVFKQIDVYVSKMEANKQDERLNRYGQLENDLLVDTEDVRSALRDFWGGPRLTESGLLQLNVVQRELNKHDGNSTRAVQSILARAIETLKPGDDHDHNKTTPEWILYNILEMRYMQGKKVRDVANQLFMSEPDFYRKQRIAIEEVARTISDMERSQLEEDAQVQTFDQT